MFHAYNRGKRSTEAELWHGLSKGNTSLSIEPAKNQNEENYDPFLRARFDQQRTVSSYFNASYPFSRRIPVLAVLPSSSAIVRP